MRNNVEAGVVYIAAAVLIGYTWWVGAWAGLLQAIAGQVTAGGTQQHPRAPAP